MVKKILLLFLCLLVVVLAVIYVQEFEAFMWPPRSNGKALVIELQGDKPKEKRHRLFTVFEFPAKKNPPSALILFGSGDGGWTPWEEAVSRDLQDSGYTVMGIDSADYAASDYDLTTLQADYITITKRGLADYPVSPPPVIVGGWSMGAAQAVAVGGGPNRPPGLVGLLLVSPSSRGRFGLRLSDKVDVLPIGPGTFAVADFISGLNGLRIVQWHGGGDIVDSTAWLSSLTAPHREIDFPWGGHEYGYANPDFRRQLVESVAWILHPPASR